MADEQERIRQILNESFASSVEDVVINNSNNDEEDIVEEFMEQTDTEQEGEYSEEDMEEDHQHVNRYNQGFPATSNSHWLYHLNIFNEDLCRKISLLRFVKDGKRLLGLQLKSKKQTISHQELEKGVICVKATAKLSIVASTAESLFAFATLNIRALDVKLQSPTCPQCRQKQKNQKFTKIYFSTPNTTGSSQEDASALQNKIDCMTFQIKLKDIEIKNQQEDVDKFKTQNKGLREEISKMREQIRERESQTYTYQDTIKSLKRECKQLLEFKLEAEDLRKQINNLRSIEDILHGSVTDVDEILARTALDPTTLSMCVSTFKK
ncbi:hypothetical protein J6590_005961 [Homalodisca vitripennis]|nr:hypothetical protein J6590_005961 [Homalodisca vitripennis]